MLAAQSGIAAPALAEPVVGVKGPAIAVPDYPETRREAIVEQKFGEAVADPYRWLESDVRSTPEVADWVERQNAVTQTYLGQIGMRDAFAARLGKLYGFARFGTPRPAGNRYFYTGNAGRLNQEQVFVQDRADAKRRLLLDPNNWSHDGASAVGDWEPSETGKYLAYSIQEGGSDWRVLRVVDVDSGAVLGEGVHWSKFSEIAWIGDEGFLYARFPEPEDGSDFHAPNFNHAIYFHRVGTDQSQDELVFATPKRPEANHYAKVTGDGRWLVIESRIGTDARNEVHLIDLARRNSRGWKARRLIKGFDHVWKIIDSADGRLFARTDDGAPNYRIMTINPNQLRGGWRELIGQNNHTISSASIVGSRLVLEYLKDAASHAILFDLDGELAGQISLGGSGAAGGFAGQAGDPETFYRFTSFNRPPSIFRLNIETGDTEVFAEPELPFDPEDYKVEQRFFTSRDGTRVPIFIVRHKALAETNIAAPTLLYGYGGFEASQTPSFVASRMAWMQAGGVFALANIRGGGEFGKAWHDAGRLANKQNTFDDFIAAGEFLKAEGYTTAKGLAIEGRSNGGLLVGAVVNQRPDLFDAAHAAVGVMDMLRFDRWTAGRYWVDDYGDPGSEQDFRNLLAYSPYHNINAQTLYPPVLVTTADTDDRVVPAHSFKYIAALQAAQTGAVAGRSGDEAAAHLIRIETRAGHGSGKPVDKEIAESADVLAFLSHAVGLDGSALERALELAE